VKEGENKDQNELGEDEEDMGDDSDDEVGDAGAKKRSGLDSLFGAVEGKAKSLSKYKVSGSVSTTFNFAFESGFSALSFKFMVKLTIDISSITLSIHDKRITSLLMFDAFDMSGPEEGGQELALLVLFINNMCQ